MCFVLCKTTLMTDTFSDQTIFLYTFHCHNKWLPSKVTLTLIYCLAWCIESKVLLLKYFFFYVVGNKYFVILREKKNNCNEIVAVSEMVKNRMFLLRVGLMVCCLTCALCFKIYTEVGQYIK